MKRTLKSILSATLALTLLTCGGCAGRQQANIFSEPQLNTAKALPSDKGDSDFAVRVTEAINAFSFSVTNVLLKEEIKENFVVSPFSVAFTLTALFNAVQGVEQERLLDAMGLSGMTAAEVNEGIAALLYELTERKQSYGNKGEKSRNQL